MIKINLFILYFKCLSEFVQKNVLSVSVCAPAEHVFLRPGGDGNCRRPAETARPSVPKSAQMSMFGNVGRHFVVRHYR